MAHNAVELVMKLLNDEEVSEIMINSPREIFFEKKGKIQQLDAQFENADKLMEFIRSIAFPSGGKSDWDGPVVSARMKDGSRVHAVFVPVVVGGGPSITIRRFLPSKLSLKSLVAGHSLSEEMAFFMTACVSARLNIIVSGGTSSGKTSLLNALSSCIDVNDRIVTIEDTAELKIRARNIVRLECQVSDANGIALTMRDLLRSALRMRPDRIIVGETRGAEAFDMLQAMNTGHDGSMTTVHANTPRDCLSRIENLSLLAAVGVTLEALRRQVASSVDLIIQTEKQRDGARKIISITEVNGMEGNTILMQEIFRYVPMGEAPDRTLLGRFAATGIVPTAMTKFKTKGIDFPKDFFSGTYRIEMNLDATAQTLVRTNQGNQGGKKSA